MNAVSAAEKYFHPILLGLVGQIAIAMAELYLRQLSGPPPDDKTKARILKFIHGGKDDA